LRYKIIESLICDIKYQVQRIYSQGRYNENTKERALQQIEDKKDEKINELTLSFD